MQDEDHLLRSYLLGELDEKDVDRLERRFLEDDDLFEMMEAVEEDLLAACARGDLPPEEQERVLSRLASSPRGRARFALVQDLTRIAEPKPEVVLIPVPTEPRPSAWRWLPVAASLLVVTGGSGLLYYHFSQQQDEGEIAANLPGKLPEHGGEVSPPPGDLTTAPPDEVDSAPEVKEPGESAPPEVREPPPTPPPVPPVVTALLALTLDGTRGSDEGSQVPPLKVAEDTERIRLKIDLQGEEQTSYNLILKKSDTEEEEQIWSRSGIRAQGPVLIVEVPASQLPDGFYALEIYGATSDSFPVGIPQFEIVR